MQRSSVRVTAIGLPGGRGTIQIDNQRLVSIGDGEHDLKGYAGITYRTPELEATLEVRDGIPVVMSIRLNGADGGPVRPTDLLAVNLKELAREAYAGGALFRPNPAGRGYMQVTSRDAYPRDLADIRGATRNKLTRQMQERVAEIYSAARAGERTDSVANRFGVGRRQAARYIASARAAGLIKAEPK